MPGKADAPAQLSCRFALVSLWWKNFVALKFFRHPLTVSVQFLKCLGLLISAFICMLLYKAFRDALLNSLLAPQLIPYYPAHHSGKQKNFFQPLLLQDSITDFHIATISGCRWEKAEVISLKLTTCIQLLYS